MLWTLRYKIIQRIKTFTAYSPPYTAWRRVQTCAKVWQRQKCGKIKMHLHCCYGLCKSDSRRQEAGVTFIPFPKPNRHPKIARKWVHLCGRHNFTINNINRATYICSKHFPAGALLGRSKNCHIGSWLLNNPTLEPFNALNMLKDEA